MNSANAGIAEFDYVVRIKQVIQMTGLGKSTIYKLRSEGAFPAPIKLSGRAVGWRTSVIEQWIAAQEHGK
jgi:prophage regulatory protein